MKLSVLDQSPISRGSNPMEALDNTLKLAQFTEELGYTRFWVAEHHNTNGLASTSPEILIARIASVTSRIRVGSGGVLLPQYSPFKVAENFKMLEALFPGRIDLGVGRSPGGSQQTRMALTDGVNKSLQSFPRQLEELNGFLHNTLPREHQFRTVKAGPRVDTNPEMWVLGISERGATNAANIGAGFSYGHFINPENGQTALNAYRDKFVPTSQPFKSKSNVCVFVVCADTQEEAESLALSQDKWLLSVGKGGDTKVPSIEEVQQKSFTQEELDTIHHNRKRTIIGTPETVKSQLIKLSNIYHTDEFLIITNIHDFQAKLHSYKLLAQSMLSDHNNVM